ncbi:ABC transporter permease [Lachnoclostridium sp. Marseille-P6806]|uniref:ABC transporter permease n=1 Tax=Lachnoclostridium sp. Marseille-P6806 TaxID=2364793 RepID=UPI0013EEFF70|nr:ABC transporter permease subunit [Lachnoclostridium sp. Marseille-P6806]
MKAGEMTGNTGRGGSAHGWKYVKKQLYKNRCLYAMIAFPILYFIIFKYGAIGWLGIAFKNFNAHAGFWKSKWVGLKYFKMFLKDPYFYSILKNTVLISLWCLVFYFPVPIILALLINEVKNYMAKKLVQTITYLPYFISTVVVCSLVVNIFATDGLINEAVVFFGGEAKTYMSDPSWFRPIYVITEIWQHAGWGSIIYLAALSGVDQQLYEAASIDGATRWQQVLHVSLPGIASIISIQFLLMVGRMLTVGYEKILLLYTGSTYSTADVISTYVYRRGLINANYSYGAAISIFQAMLSLILIFAANKAADKIGAASLW